MLRLFKQILGINVPARGNRESRDGEIEIARSSASSGRGTSDSYFATMLQMQEAISKRDYERAAGLVRENLRLTKEEALKEGIPYVFSFF